jgi:hypothetical protein|tara:strand:+ start:10578 stop:11651 length:1074 start_codon:yes stop_codon:yes gene_type:complete
LKLNKLYICGASHSGKSLVWELIDPNPNVIVVPHHNFGLSHIYNDFLSKITASQNVYNKRLLNANYKKKYVLNIKSSDKLINHIHIGDLLQYLISNNPCFRDIFTAHYSKHPFMHVSTGTYRLDLSFDVFMTEFEKLILKYGVDDLTIEQIDNMIYLSYIKSINKSKSFNATNDYFVLAGNNSIKQITTLFKYYNNFKIVVIERDFITNLYAISRHKINPLKIDLENENDMVYEQMLKMLNKLKVERFNYFNIIENYLKFEDKIIKIKFEDLKLKSSLTMNKIYQFLNLIPHDGLISPLSGVRMGVASVEKDPYDIYDKSQISYLNRMLNSQTRIQIPARNKFYHFFKKSIRKFFKN